MGLRWAWLAGGAAGMALLLVFLGRERPGAHPPVSPWTWGTDPAIWGRHFPREHQSWLKAREPSAVDLGHGPGRTKWGGPGSVWREPLPLFAGEALASGAEPAVRPPRHPVSCQVCHKPETLALRVTQPDFLLALAAHGIDPAKLPPQELDAYVCAQCHAARWPDRERGKALFPLSEEGILAVSEETGRADWTHARSGVPLLEVSSATYELWRQGEHARRGVSCVACHMPSQREGSLRVTSHAMKSPLLDVNASCGTCHRGGERELLARVEAIQDTTAGLRRRSGEALLAAHEALGEARRAGASPQALAPAWALLRQAQTRWAFIASEPSTGFHAPQAAIEQLGTALDQARQAQLLAQRSQAGVKEPGGAGPARP